MPIHATLCDLTRRRYISRCSASIATRKYPRHRSTYSETISINAFDLLGWYLFFKVSPFVIHLIRWNLSANSSIYAIIRKCLYVTSPFPFQNLTNFRMRYFTSIFFLLRYPSASQLHRWQFLLADFAARQASDRIRGSFEGITANASKRESEGFRQAWPTNPFGIRKDASSALPGGGVESSHAMKPSGTGQEFGSVFRPI
jgi:hypothetical protein